jgi:transcriptional regulator with XRE-family HTH domain
MRRAELHRDLGAFLREYREKSCLSQGFVAKSLGYSSPQFVSNFERGLCSPPFNKLRILVDLYKIPVSDLTRLLLKSQEQLIRAHLEAPLKRRRHS